GVSWLLWPGQWQGNLISSIVALAVCLIPSVATLLWSSWGFKQSPEQQLTIVLGGTGIRMFFVLGVGLIVSLSIGFIREHALFFWAWILILYLYTLGLEMFILLRSQ